MGVDLTRVDHVCAHQTVKGWLDALGKKLEVAINYTERLHSVIVSRANYVRRKLRSLKHGRNQENL